jgi:hypothetical protein
MHFTRVVDGPVVKDSGAMVVTKLRTINSFQYDAPLMKKVMW